MSEMQLEMNLNPVAGNRLREALENGRFVTLIETQVPAGEMDKSSGIQRLEALEKTVLSSTVPDAALAIVDNLNRRDWTAVELATSLSAENRDRHLVYLSGAGLSPEGVLEQIQMAENAGIRNLVPVSGEVPEKLRSARECRKMPFTESTDILRLLAQRKKDFFPGCTVNPFQYTPYTLMGSYYKLIQKFNSGAGFVVTQMGWDMHKLQSLAWYLTERSQHYPKIARLSLLSPEKVESICAGNPQGVKLSRDMRELLQKEFTCSKTQFESVQFRRLRLQAVGCRLFGFSGIQINGADNPARAEFILREIRNALEECTSFENWLDEYNSFMASTEMAPFSSNFQLYDRLLYRSYPYDDPPQTRELPLPEVSLMEKFSLKFKSFLFAHADSQRAANSHLLKVLLCGCRGCNKCRLPQKSFICPHTCPMKLVNGICGSVAPDGSCPYSGQECVHHRILRISHARNRLAEQENLLPPSF